MPISWFIISLVCSLAAIGPSALLTLQTWECRRYARGRLKNRRLHQNPPSGRVMLLSPCKGRDLGLAENLRALLQLDHPDYHVRFVVESAEDPACEVISRVLAEHPHVPAEIVVAGQGVQSGQKVHNLQAALKNLPPEVQFIAFVDSDARPDPGWLRALTWRLEVPEIGAVTGYRWLIPQRNTLANLCLYSLNCAAAGLYGPAGFSPVWGGAWAIRRDVLEKTALADAWHGTLSDDLVASRVIHGAGLKVEFEPCCMTASHAEMSFSQMFEFLRRQLLIGRRYLPWGWRMLAAGTTLLLAAMLGNGLLAAWGFSQGWSYSWLPAVSAAGLVILGGLRAAIRQDAGRRFFPQLAEKLRLPALFDILAGPCCLLLLAGGIAASAVGSCITWRGIRYHIAPGGRILLLGRKIPPQSAKITSPAAQPQAIHKAA